jgi:hypothetical protein
MNLLFVSIRLLKCKLNAFLKPILLIMMYLVVFSQLLVFDNNFVAYFCTYYEDCIFLRFNYPVNYIQQGSKWKFSILYCINQRSVVVLITTAVHKNFPLLYAARDSKSKLTSRWMPEYSTSSRGNFSVLECRAISCLNIHPQDKPLANKKLRNSSTNVPAESNHMLQQMRKNWRNALKASGRDKAAGWQG